MSQAIADEWAGHARIFASFASAAAGQLPALLDLTDYDVQQLPGADRRAIDPPIEVQTAHVVASWPP